MATDQTYLAYLLDQLREVPDLTCRAMMGEYILYEQGRIAAYVCDDTLFVKPVPFALAMLPDVPLQPPYPGAKGMLPVERTDDRDFLTALFVGIRDQLPLPKPKKKKTDAPKASR